MKNDKAIEIMIDSLMEIKYESQPEGSIILIAAIERLRKTYRGKLSTVKYWWAMMDKKELAQCPTRNV